MRSFPVLAFLLVLHFSCRRPDPMQLAAVDRLMAGCDSLADAVNAIDIGAYRRMDSIFGMQRAWFDDRFKDTLDTSTAMLLGNYHRAMNGPLQELLAEHGLLTAGLDTSRVRLGRLKHDLQAALLEEEAATAALSDEGARLSQWRSNAGVLKDGLQAIDPVWEQCHTAVDTMIFPHDSSTFIEQP